MSSHAKVPIKHVQVSVYVIPTESPESDGTLAYSHTNCSWTTTAACPSNQIGEVNLNLRRKLGNSTFSPIAAVLPHNLGVVP